MGLVIKLALLVVRIFNPHRQIFFMFYLCGQQGAYRRVALHHLKIIRACYLGVWLRAKAPNI